MRASEALHLSLSFANSTARILFDAGLISPKLFMNEIESFVRIVLKPI